MKKVLCGTFIIFIYLQITADLLTVHVNDTWEYRYEKTRNSYTELGQGENDIIRGTFVLKIDSIITNSNPDTRFVFVTKSDSMWSNKAQDTPTKRTSQQLIYKISGDTMVETTSGNKFPHYFAYWQLPDTSWGLSGKSFERKTLVQDTFVNSASLTMRKQTDFNIQSTETPYYQSIYSDADTLIWIDTIGLFQQVSHNYSRVMAEQISSINVSNTIECITLMKRNGKEINLFKTSTVSTPFKGIYTNNGLTKKTRYYSINGCIHDKVSSSQMGSRLIVQVNPGNQSCVEKIVQLFK
jgi:hypothetical protein